MNVADGKAAWTFKTRSEIKSSPVVVGDTVLIGSYDGSLYGAERRRRQAAVVVRDRELRARACRAIVNGVAHFAGCDEVFHAVRVSDGREASADLGHRAYTAASAAHRRRRGVLRHLRQQVMALDIGARRSRWRYEHPDRKFPFYSSAAIAGDLMVLGGRDRMVHALDLATGKPKWTFMTRARIDSSPAIAGGRVLVGIGDGRVYVLDLASGRKVWEFEPAPDSPPRPPSPPAASSSATPTAGSTRSARAVSPHSPVFHA